MISIEFTEQALTELDFEVKYGESIAKIELANAIGLINAYTNYQPNGEQPAQQDDVVLVFGELVSGEVDNDIINKALLAQSGNNPIKGIYNDGEASSELVCIYENSAHNAINLDTVFDTVNKQETAFADIPNLHSEITTETNELGEVYMLKVQWQPTEDVATLALMDSTGMPIKVSDNYTGRVYIGAEFLG